ncbi:MAG: hypothetical protein HQK87_08290 [Nitrospinae bacterium]|nr:hypothetical protein [Nitrospinota bacterium]
MISRNNSRNYEEELVNLRKRLEEMESNNNELPRLQSTGNTFDKYNELFDTIKLSVIKKIEENFTLLYTEIQSIKNDNNKSAIPNINDTCKQIFSKITELESVITKASSSKNIENINLLFGDIISFMDTMSGALNDIKGLTSNIDVSFQNNTKLIEQRLNTFEEQLKDNVDINIDTLKEGVTGIIKFLLFLDTTIRQGEHNIKTDIYKLGSNIQDDLQMQIGSIREGLVEIIKFLIYLSEKKPV